MTLIKEGKKGFGFTIERGEVNQGSAAVLVATITRGGPAESSGKLEIGDQILTVDGQKILGYAYEKVWKGHISLRYNSLFEQLVWPHEVDPWFHSWYRGRVESLDAKYNLAYINSTLCGRYSKFFPQARLLIQQAKGRGQVTIVVVSRSVGSNKNSHSVSGPDLTIDSKISDVVLREKSKHA